MAIDLWRGLAKVISQSTIGSNKAISRSRTLIIRFLKLIAQHFRTHLLNVVIFKNKALSECTERGFEWCHQKTSFISKWLYIFALNNRNKRNLPLLLHLISAPFCSVSQSRVPTLMQR